MEETKIVDARTVGVQVDETGAMALITVTNGASDIVRLQLPVEGVLQLTEAIDQGLMNAMGDQKLGNTSVLERHSSVPQTGIPLRMVTACHLQGFEAGGRLVELRTNDGQVFRFGFDVATANGLSAALAPGGDELPPGTNPN